MGGGGGAGGGGQQPEGQRRVGLSAELLELDAKEYVRHLTDAVGPNNQKIRLLAALLRVGGQGGFGGFGGGEWGCQVRWAPRSSRCSGLGGGGGSGSANAAP